LSGAVQRPWQTAFEWEKQLQLLLARRTATMVGDVGMVHLSGEKVSRPEGLNVPKWPAMVGGREATLGCGKLMARFGEPTDRAERRDDEGETTFDMGSRFGHLEMFAATRDVVLEDERYTLSGQRLRYNRTDGLAVLWGYMEGQRRYDAEVAQKDRLAGARVLKASKFHCYLADGQIQKVVVAEATGRGGR
jgi:hypothetical protein